MASPPHSLIRLLFSELRRRGVFRAGAIYLVGAWIAIQVADTTFPALGLPVEWVTGVVIAAIIGLPVAVGGAWFFDVHRDVRDVDPAVIPVLSSTQARLTILAAIALGTSVLTAAAWITLRAPDLPDDAGPPPNSIAVLYLDDRTGDPSLGYLPATLTETLTAELAQVNGLRVISSNGVRAWQEAGVTLDSLGRALGVGTVITGSVAAARDSVRVALQLVDPQTGVVMETHDLQRHSADGFALVDELVRDVARKLREVVGQRVAVRAFRAGTGSPEAWALVQRARQLQAHARDLEGVGGVAGAERALAEADSLLALAERHDGGYTDAIIERAAVARGRMFVALSNGPQHAMPFLQEAVAHAERAVRNDGGDARALEYHGALLDLQLTFTPSADTAQRARLAARAEQDLRAAVNLDTTRARAYSTLSSILESRAQFAEARLMANRAYAADAYLENSSELLTRLFKLSFELGDDVDASRRCTDIRRSGRLHAEAAMCELMLRAWTQVLDADIDAAWAAVASASQRMSPARVSRQRPHLEALTAGVIARARHADSARAVLRRAIAAAPDDSEVIHLAASVHLLLGDEARARDELARYVRMEGRLPDHIASSRRFAALRPPG